MNVSDPLFSYLTVLAVIQPGRIQDIEMYAPDVLPSGVSEPLLASGALRDAHTFAKENGYVMQVRRGTYFLTARGRELVRRNGLHKQLDNLRMFLMKDQRRKYR